MRAIITSFLLSIVFVFGVQQLPHCDRPVLDNESHMTDVKVKGQDQQGKQLSIHHTETYFRRNATSAKVCVLFVKQTLDL